MKRATGIGGFFFKSEDPEKLSQWYEKHLGISFDKATHGALEWNEEGGMTVFSMFPKDTNYFNSSDKDFMFNFRVDDLEKLLEKLKTEGVTVMDKVEKYEYGKFGWILDPEGNKIELWEPAEEDSAE